MVQWTAEQLTFIDRYNSLEEIPFEERKYKCTNNGCKVIIKAEHLIDGKICPVCHKSSNLEIMCPLDTNESCAHTTAKGIEVCPICGHHICPDCGNHDVVVLSRVTGYYSPVDSWGQGKVSELNDRRRYVI